MRSFGPTSHFKTFCVVLGLAAALCTNLVQAKGPAEGSGAATFGSIGLSQMPKQGQDTYALIVKGGPFPYDKDGTVFGNRERLLPMQKRGYYREYTVKTPYARNRGAKRIVCGGAKPQAPDACFYTDDHYASFRKLSVN